MAQRCVFLDRDGTIIEDTHYIRDPNDVKLLPNAIEGLKAMTAKGYWLFVISNQSGVGRGIIADAQFKAVHAKTCELLQEAGVEIQQFLYCFHTPEDECKCRKPNAGLIPRTHAGVELDWQASFTVGDKDCDLDLAAPLGANPILVLTGKGKQTQAVRADVLACADLREVAEKIP